MIRVYSKVKCPYCEKAKTFFKEKNLVYEEVLMDPEHESYAQQRDELVAKTDHKTFPFIFVGEEFVGGYTDMVHAFETLRLHELCEKIGIALEYDF